jgi:glutamate dehydrogenase (NADP+)
LNPVIEKHPEFEENAILERLVEPERGITFKVTWVDDAGKVQVNKGYRYQFNSAIGPYKGGVRFAPSVYPGIIKFLGFEQIFKNSLTGLPIGGGKGGADFDPNGKSDAEIMRFCQAFMTELYRHIGPETDIPAGDLGVGAKEIGYMFGQYKKIVNQFEGVLTGKGLAWGGLYGRAEATGFGIVYYAEAMLKANGESLKDKEVAISGFGNVTWGTALKLNELGAKLITISGPDGYIYDPDGISGDKVDYLLELRGSGQNICEPYATKYPNAKFVAGKKPWEVKVDIAMPCAIQNELGPEDAKQLIANGVTMVAEVSNMGCKAEAIHELQKAKVIFAPGKAVNAGGVSVSGLEMSQNALKYGWSAKEVDEKLHDIMQNIHENCVKYGKEKDGYINYVKGANVAGFIKVADTMIDLGVC